MYHLWATSGEVGEAPLMARIRNFFRAIADALVGAGY